MTREDIIEHMKVMGQNAARMDEVMMYVMTRKDCEVVMAAAELLKTQEPRVLTPDEVKNAPEKSVVWLELKPDEIFKEEIYPFVGSGTGWYSCYCSANTTPMFTDDDVEKYGIEFRCWTSRPTDEQREAVKWIS